MILSRKWILVASLVLSVAMAVSGTLAYMTDTDTRVNTFEMGNVDISIIETNVQNTLTPGASATKNAKISNDGANDAWVWMTVTLPAGVTPTWADGITPDKTENDDNGNTVYTVMVDTVLASGTATGDILVGVEMDEKVDRVNGQLALVENGVVTPVTVGEDGKVIVTVNAYAVQKEGFNSVEEAYAAYYEQWGDVERPNEGAAGNNTVVDNAEAFEAALENDGSINLNGSTVTGDLFSSANNVAISNGTIDSTSTSGYGYMVELGGSATFDNINLKTDAGGLNVRGTTVFNSGSIVTDSMNTSARHVFYVAGGSEADGHLTINGGEFTFSPTNLTRKGSYLCAHGEGAVIIVNGGTFNKPSTRTAPIQALEGGTVTIYGGRFAFDPSEFVAEGYTATQGTDGYWTVAKD